MRKLLKRQLAAGLLFLLGITWLPAAWNSRWADRWFEGDAHLQSQLANGVTLWLDGELGRDDFTTGS